MFDIQIHQRIKLSLTLADVKQIKKVCDRLRIVRTGATTHDDGIVFTTVLCVERDAAQIQDL